MYNMYNQYITFVDRSEGLTSLFKCSVGTIKDICYVNCIHYTVFSNISSDMIYEREIRGVFLDKNTCLCYSMLMVMVKFLIKEK